MKVEIRKVAFTITTRKPKPLNGNVQYLLTSKNEATLKTEIETENEITEMVMVHEDQVWILIYLRLFQKIGGRVGIPMAIFIFIMSKRKKPNGNVHFRLSPIRDDRLPLPPPLLLLLPPVPLLPFVPQMIAQNGKNVEMKNLAGSTL